MATRALIGLMRPDKTIAAMYCHFDGYPSGVGAILEDYYNTYEKIDELIRVSKGEISSLGKEIGPLEDLAGRDRYQKGYTTFYRTNLEDGENKVKTFYGKYSFYNHAEGGIYDYAYLFEDGGWFSKWL
jgi:hypothetical protein